MDSEIKHEVGYPVEWLNEPRSVSEDEMENKVGKRFWRLHGDSITYPGSISEYEITESNPSGYRAKSTINNLCGCTVNEHELWTKKQALVERLRQLKDVLNMVTEDIKETIDNIMEEGD